MKTIKVTFPDGSVRDCRAMTKVRHSSEIPAGPPRIAVVPTLDRAWEFYPVLGGWRARKR